MIPLNWHLNDNYLSPESAIGPCAIASSDSIAGLQEQLASVLYVVPGAFTLNADDTLAMAGGLAPVAPIAMALHLGEYIFIYPHGFVAITQLNGQFGVFRIAS